MLQSWILQDNSVHSWSCGSTKRCYGGALWPWVLSVPEIGWIHLSSPFQQPWKKASSVLHSVLDLRHKLGRLTQTFIAALVGWWCYPCHVVRKYEVTVIQHVWLKRHPRTLPILLYLSCVWPIKSFGLLKKRSWGLHLWSPNACSGSRTTAGRTT